ncbi:WYL domain-containing protein [Rhizobium sp. CF142]|uniref:WYL domain-containing protein n=1 Tax=Rhizobium sp. CF142 TaxID=1144314 RepID=UPI00031E26AC|nr:WYL domain-containing protein [Rhizobium sp. CF142]
METLREVEPQAMLILPPLWYLVAWDAARADFRHFRMDRISKPEIVEGTQFRRRHVPFEDDVCLSAKWRAEYQRGRNIHPAVTIRAASAARASSQGRRPECAGGLHRIAVNPTLKLSGKPLVSTKAVAGICRK